MSSKEDYLRAIYNLTDGGESKTSTSELSSEMEVSNASSSEAVQKLEDENKVCRAAYKGFTLSPMGKEEGKKLAEKHRRLENLFQKAGVENPEKEADSVEHAISTEALKKMEEYIERNN